MLKGVNLKGLKIGELDALQATAEKTIEDVRGARVALFKSALLVYTSKPTQEVKELDEKLHSRIDDVLDKIRNLDHEIYCGHLYDLQCKFGESVDVCQLLVDVGLMTKIWYHHDTLHDRQSHQFDNEEDMLSCIEVCGETGRKAYYDPLQGIEVSKETFDNNVYYTLLPTTLYKKIYSELLEVYQNLEVV